MSILRPEAYCSSALALALGLCGCTTKSHANAEARAAYAAGQQQARMHMQETQTPSVTVHGAVRNPLIPWTEGLTVAKAIVDAGYSGAQAPSQIVIVRKGVGYRIEPQQLLNGNDPPLQPGDILDIR